MYSDFIPIPIPIWCIQTRNSKFLEYVFVFLFRSPKGPLKDYIWLHCKVKKQIAVVPKAVSLKELSDKQ